MTDIEKRNAYLVLVLAVFCFSFSSIFIRLSDAPAPAIAAYRMILATLLIAPFALVRSRKRIASLNRGDTWFLVATGAVLALHFLFFVTAVQNTTVASATVLINCHPIFVAVLAFLLLHEGSKYTTAGALIGMGGIIVISVGGPGQREHRRGRDGDAGGIDGGHLYHHDPGHAQAHRRPHLRLHGQRCLRLGPGRDMRCRRRPPMALFQRTSC